MSYDPTAPQPQRLTRLRRALSNGRAFPSLIGKRASFCNLRRFYLGGYLK